LIRAADNSTEATSVRARAIEALGKIVATLPKGEENRAKSIGNTLLNSLKAQQKSSGADNHLVLLSLTAVLRARPEGAGKVVAGFLSSPTIQVRADAANTLARLRARDGNEQLRTILISDPDAVVRANAARVLGATEDTAAFAGLLNRAVSDRDSRVRVSAIRALSALKDERAAEPLLKHGRSLQDKGELLEIATALGRILQWKGGESSITWLTEVRKRLGGLDPEIEISLVRLSPDAYLKSLGNGAMAKRKAQETILTNWRAASSLAQGLGEVAAIPDTSNAKRQLATDAQSLLRALLDYKNSGLNINTLVAVHSEYAIPDVLRALAAFKPSDLGDVLRTQLTREDVIVRATSAELIGELAPDDTNLKALIAALATALQDTSLNDAALATLDSLGKFKNKEADEAITSALKAEDVLVRRRAATILKSNGAGDFSAQVVVRSKNTNADYQRALARIGKAVRANVITTAGTFTVELLPEEAPLNVDNFVQLAQRKYFNGISFHRVVPNFVIQGGDPRGDGNGGPGYAIRCEINEVPFERGTVGMALSGKDTGGSQWFVTHSPQPHLDGGYTVFGRVVTGMAVVDAIQRGDVIRSIAVKELPRRRQ
jgi:cyclophilin family peptidyl-prolyl cis-trans isomerase/HEAT repeat protein